MWSTSATFTSESSSRNVAPISSETGADKVPAERKLSGPSTPVVAAEMVKLLVPTAVITVRNGIVEG